MGREYPLPSRLGDLWSVISSHSGVQARAPSRLKTILLLSKHDRTPVMHFQCNFVLSFRI